MSEYDVDGNPTGDRSTRPVSARITAATRPGRSSSVDDGLVATRFALRRARPHGRPDPRPTQPACRSPTTAAVVASAVIGPGRRHHSPVLQPGRAAAPGSSARQPHRTARVRRRRGAWPRSSTATAGARSTATTPTALLVERISPAGLTESLERDAAGRVGGTTCRPGTPAYAYDAAGRVVAVTDRARTAALPPRRAPGGWCVTDALGHITGYAYDVDGRLVAHHRPPRPGRTATQLRRARPARAA